MSVASIDTIFTQGNLQTTGVSTDLAIQGTWQDSNWDANWTFNADGKIVLTKASSGETVFTFDDSNVQKFKILPTTSGLSISFDCEETERSYKFTKPITLNADLDMHIDPKWTSEGYDVKIKFQK